MPSSTSSEDMEVDLEDVTKSPTPTPSPTPEAPVDMRWESNRLRSFDNTILDSGFPPVEELAKNGFSVSTWGQIVTMVTCTFCLIEVKVWPAGMNAHQGHVNLSPDCPFNCGKYVGNIESNDTSDDDTSDSDSEVSQDRTSLVIGAPPKYPEFVNLCNRLFSFLDTWPLAFKLTAEKLANTGFFLEKPLQDKLWRLVCYQCGIRVDVDQSTSKPASKIHELISPLCPLVLCKHKIRPLQHLRVSPEWKEPDVVSNIGTRSADTHTAPTVDHNARSEANTDNNQAASNCADVPEATTYYSNPGYQSLRSGHSRPRVLPRYVRSDRSNPIADRYKCLFQRKNSFCIKWIQTLKYLVKHLAQAGFYNTGQGDLTKCYACGVEIRNWNISDKPWTQHIIHSPDCEHVLANCSTRKVRETLLRHRLMSESALFKVRHRDMINLRPLSVKSHRIVPIDED